jgi:hypothetical protein
MRAAERRGKKIQLYKFVIARSDVTEALRTFRLVDAQGRNYPLYDPLFQGAVISYSRPFKASKPFGRLSGSWAKFEDPPLQTTHDFLIRTRDRYVAHGDIEVRKVKIVPRGALWPYRDPNPALTAAVSTTWRVTEPFDRVIDTCQDLSRRIHEESERLFQELYGDRSDLPGEPFMLDPDDDP